MRAQPSTLTTPSGFRSVRRYTALRTLVAGLALLALSVTQWGIALATTSPSDAGYGIQIVLAAAGISMVITGVVRSRRC